MGRINRLPGVLCAQRTLPGTPLQGRALPDNKCLDDRAGRAIYSTDLRDFFAAGPLPALPPPGGLPMSAGIRPPSRSACALDSAALCLVSRGAFSAGEFDLMRFQIQPGDVPPMHAARRMGMLLAEFSAALPRLVARGFPAPDPDTGNFDLDAIDAWRRARHPHLFGGTEIRAQDAGKVALKRIAALRSGR